MSFDLPHLRPGHLIAIEVPSRADAGRQLRAWADGLSVPGRARVVLRCDAHETGLWAGLNDWLEALVPALQRDAPDLVDRHSHEIVTILPGMRRRIRSTKTTLTDEAPPDETVRNYSIDRGYRIGHGAVDLVAEWHRRTAATSLLVVCLDFDRAGVLVQRFFRELMRREARSTNITMVLTTAPGAAGHALASFDPSLDAEVVPWTGGPTAAAPVAAADPRAQGRRAEAIEAAVQQDPLEMEIRLPQLIRLWEHSDRPQRALSWMAFALGLYNHYGFYEDAFQYVEPVLENLDAIEPIEGFEYFFTRWNLVGSVFGCLVANGHPERADRVVECEALAKITDDEERVRVHYVKAMLHARFLGDTDLERGEHHLREGLRLLAHAEGIEERDRVFLSVFLENGLAFIRHRQGRPREAIELCRRGFERMSRHWQDDQHRLHRSVLLYNQAQVYAAIGEHDEAIALYSGALDMDPNYSEYYNERGNVLAGLGRFDEAIADYRRAIDTSPPYAEVWTNLGQCYRKMDRLEPAVAAFSRALDLDPEFELARVGRAQCLDALERGDEAEADYDRLLCGDAADPLLWANRAVLRFQRGAVEDSLRDLDRAIALAPQVADLYQNRAVAFESLGDRENARNDLEAYLRLAPDAADRSAVEARLAGFA